MADIDINTAPPTADVEGEDYVVVIKKEAVSAPGTPTDEADGLAANHQLNIVKVEDIATPANDAAIDTDTPSNESETDSASRQAIAEMGRDILDDVVSDAAIDTDSPSTESMETGASRQSIAEMGREIFAEINALAASASESFGGISSLVFGSGKVFDTGEPDDVSASFGPLPDFVNGVVLPPNPGMVSFGAIEFDDGVELPPNPGMVSFGAIAFENGVVSP